MENRWVTTGRIFHPNVKLPFCYTDTEPFATGPDTSERFRLIFINQGNGIIQLGEQRFSFIAPVIACFNEREAPKFAQGTIDKAQAIFFHPRMINKVYNFENIRKQFEDKADNDYFDRIYLLPFLFRRRNPGGIIPLGPTTAGRVAELLAMIARELAEQRDHTWTCRSRSYLIELLVMIERVYETPDAITTYTLAGEAGETDPIIVYIHANYQYKLSISQLSQEFHLNRTTLMQRITKATGVSFLDYLNRLRVKVAALVLRDTELSVNEIMIRVGYTDLTHFSRVFRKYMGCTPTDYRQQSRLQWSS